MLRPTIFSPVVAVALAFVLGSSIGFANVSILRLSTDPFTNTTSQHKTEVEPDSLSFGNTIVSTFQAGRFFDGGASDIGWATSIDGGTTWKHGFLPGITKIQNPSNPYDRVSDPAVAFDPKAGVWLISSLAIKDVSGGIQGAAVLVSRSTDGIHWNNPVKVATASSFQNFDKEWVVCDTTASSPFYGRCYVEWDDNGAGNLILMSTSTDSGLTWGSALPTANGATGLGGQPLVQPNGTVVVPIDNANETAVLSFISTNGGTSWSNTVLISAISSHAVAGNLRTSPLVSAEIDASGKVYVVWQDCRFRASCTSNDIVMSTSANGLVWTAVTRIPIDATTSGMDHFIPGIAVDRTTSGASTHIGLTYYFYPAAACSSSTCQLDVGFISSTSGGTSWSASTEITGPMKLSWLAKTSQGVMVGDYISSSFNSSGLTHGFFARAFAPSTTTGLLNEAIYTNKVGLAQAEGAEVVVAAEPVLSTRSDHAEPATPLTRR